MNNKSLNLFSALSASLIVCAGVILVFMRKQLRDWDDQISSTKKHLSRKDDQETHARFEEIYQHYKQKYPHNDISSEK